MYFSWNSPKGYTKEERGAERKKKGSAPGFLPCAGNPQTRGLNFPPWSLSSFARIITLSFSHPFSSYTSDSFLFRPLVLVYLLRPLVFRYFLVTSFIPPRNSFLRTFLPFSSGLFSWRTARLRFRIFDYLVYFFRVSSFFFFSFVSAFLSIID